jgi:hypothetical protein
MLTDTACRNLKPKAKPYKRATAAVSICWLSQPARALAYGLSPCRQTKEAAFGANPEITLPDARERRDGAKKLLAHGSDPAVAKQEAKGHRPLPARSANGPMNGWKGSAPRSPPLTKRPSPPKERYVGYLKGEFGSRLIPEIKRPDISSISKGSRKPGNWKRATAFDRPASTFAYTPISRARITTHFAM